MTTARFVAAIVALAAIMGSAAVAGWTIARALPPRNRTVRALAATVIAVAVVIVTAELLGTVGLFRLAPLVIGTVVVSGALVVLARRFPAPAVAEHRVAGAATTPPRWLLGAAALTVAAVAVRWVSATPRSLENGILESDSRHYHLSFAAEFARSGWVTRYQPIWPDPVHLFYPANSDLFHGIGMVAMSRDVLVPLANLG